MVNVWDEFNFCMPTRVMDFVVFVESIIYDTIVRNTPSYANLFDSLNATVADLGIW